MENLVTGTRLDDPRSAPAQQSDWPFRYSTTGWSAELMLRFARRGQRTVVRKARQRGPLTIQRPFYPEGEQVSHVYLLHPPAGIVGGDDLRVGSQVTQGAHALITTPGATRWHFSRGIDAQSQHVARVGPAATLEWLPQETLLFDGAHAKSATRIELEADARFCGWEILGLGRPAVGERFERGRIDFRFELFRDQRPVLLERQVAGAGGFPGLWENAACATFVSTNAAQAALAASRAILSGAPKALAASTLIGDILVVRGLAANCEPLMGLFSDLWKAVRPITIKRAASIPRIWHT